MFFAFRPETRVLESIDVLPQSGWLHVVSPTPAEIELLCGKLVVPQDFLRHALDVDEMARLDKSGEARLVMLRVPRGLRSGRRLPFRVEPIGVVILEGMLVTVAHDETE